MHEWSREGLDQVSNELPEQVESTSDDPGGMPYDDDLGEDAERPVTAWRTRLRLGEVSDGTQHRPAERGTVGDAGAAPIRALALGRGRPRHPRQAATRGACRRYAEPPQLGHCVGLAVARSRSRPSGRRCSDRVLPRQHRRPRHPGGARLPGLAVLEVVCRMAHSNTESQDRHGPTVGTVVAHRANLAVGQPADVDRSTAR